MSVISKDLAGQIAYKLTEKSRLASEKLHTEYRELVTLLYEEQTPQEVKQMLKKFPDWVYTRSGITFTGHGFRYESVSATRKVVCNTNSDATLHLTQKIADKIAIAMRKWEKAATAYKQLKDETRQILLTLKTFRNIRKELPQASQYLPPPMSNALVINLDSFKKRLDRQPDVKHPIPVDVEVV